MQWRVAISCLGLGLGLRLGLGLGLGLRLEVAPHLWRGGAHDVLGDNLDGHDGVDNHAVLDAPAAARLAERCVIVVKVAEAVAPERDERTARDRTSGDRQDLEEE